MKVTLSPITNDSMPLCRVPIGRPFVFLNGLPWQTGQVAVRVYVTPKEQPLYMIFSRMESLYHLNEGGDARVRLLSPGEIFTLEVE